MPTDQVLEQQVDADFEPVLTPLKQPESSPQTQSEPEIFESNIEKEPPQKAEILQPTESVPKAQLLSAPSFHTNNGSVLSTRSRIEVIAKQHHIDAFIRAGAATETPAQRCLNRRNYLALKQQNNLEKIMQYAYYGSRDAVAATPDPDWLARFLDLAQNIHNEVTQKMWGRILRKELLTPNFISLKSLTILESMSQKEIQLFQNACALTSRYGNDPSRKIIIGYERPTRLLSALGSSSPNNLSLGDFQLPYSNLLVLMDLGLLFRSELLSGSINKNNQVNLAYHDTTYYLKAKYNQMKLSYYRLTQMGNELCDLLGTHKKQAYIDTITSLLAQGFEVRS